MDDQDFELIGASTFVLVFVDVIHALRVARGNET